MYPLEKGIRSQENCGKLISLNNSSHSIFSLFCQVLAFGTRGAPLDPILPHRGYLRFFNSFAFLRLPHSATNSHHRLSGNALEDDRSVPWWTHASRGRSS